MHTCNFDDWIDNKKRISFPFLVYSRFFRMQWSAQPDFTEILLDVFPTKTASGPGLVYSSGRGSRCGSAAWGVSRHLPAPLKMEVPRCAIWDMFHVLRLSNCRQRILCFQGVAHPQTAYCIPHKRLFLMRNHFHLFISDFLYEMVKVVCIRECAAVKMQVRLKTKINMHAVFRKTPFIVIYF